MNWDFIATRKRMPLISRLAPECQAALKEHAEAHSLSETVAWLAGNGVEISMSALSDWLAKQGLPKVKENDLADILRQLHLIRRGVGELAEVMATQLEKDADRRSSPRPLIARLKRVGESMSGPA